MRVTLKRRATGVRSLRNLKPEAAREWFRLQGSFD